MDGIDPWDLLREQRIREGHAAYIANPNYPALVEEARGRGFRHCTLNELLYAPTCDPDTYTWKGGCWKRLPAPLETEN